jgi:hypothetical protein
MVQIRNKTSQTDNLRLHGEKTVPDFRDINIIIGPTVYSVSFKKWPRYCGCGSGKQELPASSEEKVSFQKETRKEGTMVPRKAPLERTIIIPMTQCAVSREENLG